jgi:acyl carrier protein
MSDLTVTATPTRSAVRDRLRTLLHEIAGVAYDAVDDDATIDEHLQMSSLAFVELQVAIEDEYGVELDTVHVVELNRFAALVDYVHELARRAAA